MAPVPESYAKSSLFSLDSRPTQQPHTVIWPVSGLGCAAVMVRGVSEMAAVVLNTAPGVSLPVGTDSGSVAYAMSERPTWSGNLDPQRLPIQDCLTRRRCERLRAT